MRVILEQFLGSEIVVEVGLLRGEADIQLGPWIVDRVTENAGSAGSGINRAHQELQGRGLPCAVRAQVPEHLAFFDGEIQRLQYAARTLLPEADVVRL